MDGQTAAPVPPLPRPPAQHRGRPGPGRLAPARGLAGLWRARAVPAGRGLLGRRRQPGRCASPSSPASSAPVPWPSAPTGTSFSNRTS